MGRRGRNAPVTGAVRSWCLAKESNLSASDFAHDIICIAPSRRSPYPMNHDREGEHHPLAQPVAGGEAAPQAGGDPAEGSSEHGLRRGAGDGGEDSRGTRRQDAIRWHFHLLGLSSFCLPLFAEKGFRFFCVRGTGMGRRGRNAPVTGAVRSWFLAKESNLSASIFLPKKASRSSA